LAKSGQQTNKKHKKMKKKGRLIQALSYWPVYLLLKYFFHYRVRGQENLAGLENKPIIFASNHASLIDHYIGAAAMPRRKGQLYPKNFLPIRFLAAAKFYDWKWKYLLPFKWNYLFAVFIVRINRSLPVYRSGGDLLRSLKETIKVLLNGESIWIYPEGGITKDGRLQKGKRGVAYLQHWSGAPIVPIGINGTYKLSLKRREIHVNIGKPLVLPKNYSLSEGADLVMRKIAELLDNP
jgi:1-acyl-sn-glycerol-3-phosphate acyltransferase